MGTVGLVLRVVDGGEVLHLTFRIVGKDELHRVNDSADTLCATVQVGTGSSLQQLDIVQGIEGGVADGVDELEDRLWAVATATDTADGRHTRVVPSLGNTFLGENQEVTLGHEGIVQVQLVELILTGTVVLYVVCLALPFLDPGDEEVVQLVVRHELQRTDGVGYPFQVVALPVGEVVHRISVPLGSGAPVRHVQHTVHDRITEVHVR